MFLKMVLVHASNATMLLSSYDRSPVPVSGISLFAFLLLLSLTRTRSRTEVNVGDWVPTRLCRICIKLMHGCGLDSTLPPKMKSGMGSPD